MSIFKKVLFKIYLSFASLVSRSPILSFFGVDYGRSEGFCAASWRGYGYGKKSQGTEEAALHFHAASAGELEILIPLIEVFSLKSQGGKRIPLVVTVFSTSAMNALNKVVKKLQEKGAVILWAGYSPCENEWAEFLTLFNVKKFMTSKYEAWPGLWAALSEKDIPLILIQAQFRSSLIWVSRLLKLFGIKQPRIYFFGPHESSLKELQNTFPGAAIKVSQDPRWIQIQNRAAAPHRRVIELTAQYADSPKPYGILGSVWNEDLEIILPALKNYAGTLWIVPHSLKNENLNLIHQTLKQYSIPNVIVVEEMGLLLELYSLADWVWVGGGFSQGVHSTMEPAIFGVPVSCGPKNSEMFPEIADLQSSGQLTLCRQIEDFTSFLNKPAKQGKNMQYVKDLQQKSQSFSSLVEECERIR